jgi:hypothetical protein
MCRMIVRFGATGAGALIALGLFAGPPAGAAESDRQDKAEQRTKVTCFVPEGRTQGRSMSDPDGDANGGADKPSPDCTGGVDPDDRDGNNGCGNDADREDDNNGNCGGDKARGPEDAADQSEDENGDTTTVNAEEVAGEVKVQGAGSESDSATPAAEASSTTTAADATTVSAAGGTTPAAESTTPDTQVLGETLSQPDAAPGTLARTGAGVGGLALLGGLLVGGGRLTVLARKLLRIG